MEKSYYMQLSWSKKKVFFLFTQRSPPRDQETRSSLPHYASATRPPPSVFTPSHQGGDRLSPGSLDMRLTAELNRLEYMEESVRQLTDVERTRAVSMAQQETVSFAQILKVSTSRKGYDIVLWREEWGTLVFFLHCRVDFCIIDYRTATYSNLPEARFLKALETSRAHKACI